MTFRRMLLGAALWLAVCCNGMAADGELGEIRRIIQEMEARHQQELQALRESQAKQLQAVDQRYQEQVTELTRRLHALEGQRQATPVATPAATTPTTPAVALPPANGQPDLAARIAELEANLALHQGQQDLLMSQLQDRVELHIYGTLEYQDLDDRDSAFDLRNLAMVASAEFVQRLKTMAIVELEPGAEGGYETEIDQAWMEYQVEDWFNPRFGVVLAPFGRFNMYHFDILNDLSSRPILTQTVVPVSWAEPGAGAVGTVLLEGLGLEQSSLEYQVFLVNGLNDRISDQGLARANDQANQDNNANKALVGRLGLRLAPDQEVGLSGYRGKYNDDQWATGFDVDWRFRYGPAELLGEYALFDFERGLTADGVTAPRRMSGGYLQANYHFWFDGLNETFLGRRFDSPCFTLVTRYDLVTIRDDGDAATGDNRERRLTLGLNYRPAESWAFKLEYQWNTTTHEPLDQGDADGFIFSVTTSF